MAVREFNLERKKQERLLVTTKGKMPVGLDVEVFDRESLAFLQTRPDLSDQHREHLTLYMYQRPELFNAITVPKKSNSMVSSGHYTLDTQEDLDRLRIIGQKIETLDDSIRIMTATE